MLNSELAYTIAKKLKAKVSIYARSGDLKSDYRVHGKFTQYEAFSVIYNLRNKEVRSDRKDASFVDLEKINFDEKIVNGIFVSFLE
jgi:thioredoxin reductase